MAKDRVFVSWSGIQSQKLARILEDELPGIIALDPFMSDVDIIAGARWLRVLDNELEKTHAGVLCLTAHNLLSPWVLFEAGAIAKATHSLLVPYCLDFSPSDLPGPLANFQAARVNKSGTRKMIMALEKFAGGRRRRTTIDAAFKKWWPTIDSRISAISKYDRFQDMKKLGVWDASWTITKPMLRPGDDP